MRQQPQPCGFSLLAFHFRRCPRFPSYYSGIPALPGSSSVPCCTVASRSASVKLPRADAITGSGSWSRRSNRMRRSTLPGGHAAASFGMARQRVLGPGTHMPLVGLARHLALLWLSFHFESAAATDFRHSSQACGKTKLSKAPRSRSTRMLMPLTSSTGPQAISLPHTSQ